MRYQTATLHNNWIYDSEDDLYISPKGRLAEYPGLPFFGQVAEKELSLIKERVDKEEESIREEENTLSQELTAEVVRTITIGDVTINWIRVS